MLMYKDEHKSLLNGNFLVPSSIFHKEIVGPQNMVCPLTNTVYPLVKRKNYMLLSQLAKIISFVKLVH